MIKRQRHAMSRYEYPQDRFDFDRWRKAPGPCQKPYWYIDPLTRTLTIDLRLGAIQIAPEQLCEKNWRRVIASAVRRVRLYIREQDMSSIQIKMKDGTIRNYPHEGRAGGSWTKKVRYEGAFVVVEDEWGKRVAVPANDVAEVVETPERW